MTGIIPMHVNKMRKKSTFFVEITVIEEFILSLNWVLYFSSSSFAFDVNVSVTSEFMLLKLCSLFIVPKASIAFGFSPS